MEGIVIVISKFLEHHSKAKRTKALAYSRALQRIKGVVQKVVHGKLRSDFQMVSGDITAVKVGIALLGRWTIRRVRVRVFEEMTFWFLVECPRGDG